LLASPARWTRDKETNMAGRKDGSSKQTRGQAESRNHTPEPNREGSKTVARSEAARGGSDVAPPKGQRAGASTSGQRATTVGKGEVLPQSQQSAQDECPPNPDSEDR